jgi:hypothetical protein
MAAAPCQDAIVPRPRNRFTAWQVCVLGGLAVVLGLVVAAPIAPQLAAARQAASRQGTHRSGATAAVPAAAAVPAGTGDAGAAADGAAVRTAVIPASTTVPGAPDCPMFPAGNVWNTNISRLPVDPHSAGWLRSMDAAGTYLHPDFGPNAGGYPYGMPFTIVTNSTPLVRIRFQYASESNAGPYPFGPGTPIEGGRNASGDRHAIMVNKDTCTLYELWDARYAAGRPTAGSGAIWNLRSNALRPYGWTSADAAGLPVLPGLLSFAQVKAAVADGKPITHAIRFTAAVTRSAFIWPARHQAGSGGSVNLPPMGARFRLKASFSVARFCASATPYCKDAKAVLVEMQDYGLILADNGSNWYFQGSAYPQWPDALVSLLKGIPASAFQAVDEACLMVHPYSGRASAKPGCPIG